MSEIVSVYIDDATKIKLDKVVSYAKRHFHEKDSVLESILSEGILDAWKNLPKDAQ